MEIVETKKKAEIALGYFRQGYNCAQSICAAFHEEMGVDETLALRMGSSFGGGLGGRRELCGAVSGMCLVLGMIKGYASPDDLAAKKEHYALVRKAVAEFETQYGTTCCRELLKQNSLYPKEEPSARNAEYYSTRPCARYVAACADTVQAAISG